MKAQRIRSRLPLAPALAAPVLLALAAAGCNRPTGEESGQGSTTPRYERAEEGGLLEDTQTPVRIGEQGPAFAACMTRGRLRERTAAGPAPVRAAPFDQARPIDSLAPDAEFFVCGRSIDQRFLGIVYDEGGQASERCGVSEPVPTRRDYAGPCAAGWVASAQVRLVSGVSAPPLAPPDASGERPSD